MGIRWGYASVSELGRMTHQCAQNGRNGRITRKEEPTEGGGVCMGNMERALSSDARWRWPETRSCYTGNHKTGRGDVDFMADVRGCNGKNIWTNNTTYCNATKMEETRGKYHKIELWHDLGSNYVEGRHKSGSSGLGRENDSQAKHYKKRHKCQKLRSESNISSRGISNLSQVRRYYHRVRCKRNYPNAKGTKTRSRQGNAEPHEGFHRDVEEYSESEMRIRSSKRKLLC